MREIFNKARDKHAITAEVDGGACRQFDAHYANAQTKDADVRTNHEFQLYPICLTNSISTMENTTP